MGIRVTCAKGHSLNVKDKYAGKKGRCPHCGSSVEVPIPVPSYDSANILDDHAVDTSMGASGSLVGSKVLNCEECPKCRTSVPIWHCKCNNCGHFFDGR